MQNNKGGIDIVNEVLEACILAYPVSSFVISLYKQYQQRGSLSKKQLQGLYGKTEKISNFPPGKLATLEALIKKMPNRFKSELPANIIESKDTEDLDALDQILKKYPQHKAAIFLKSKTESGNSLSTQEKQDLERFKKLL